MKYAEVFIFSFACVLSDQLYSRVIYSVGIRCRSGYFLTRAGGSIDTIMVLILGVNYDRLYPPQQR